MDRPLHSKLGSKVNKINHREKRAQVTKMALGYDTIANYGTGPISSKFMTDHHHHNQLQQIKIEVPDEIQTSSACMFSGVPSTLGGEVSRIESRLGYNTTTSTFSSNTESPMFGFCMSPGDSRDSKASGMKKLLADEMDTEPLTSWTTKHPQNWTKKEVLDWVFYVVEQESLDGSQVKGEAYRDFHGSDLIRMSRAEFQSADPVYGLKMYQTFRALISDVMVEEPRPAPSSATLGTFNQANHDHVTQLTKDIYQEVCSEVCSESRASHSPSSAGCPNSPRVWPRVSQTRDSGGGVSSSAKESYSKSSVGSKSCDSWVVRSDVGSRASGAAASSRSCRSTHSDDGGIHGQAAGNDLVIYKSGNDVEVDLPSLGVYSICTEFEFPKLSAASAFTAPLSPPSPSCSPSTTLSICSTPASTLPAMGFISPIAQQQTPQMTSPPSISPSSNQILTPPSPFVSSTEPPLRQFTSSLLQMSSMGLSNSNLNTSTLSHSVSNPVPSVYRSSTHNTSGLNTQGRKLYNQTNDFKYNPNADTPKSNSMTATSTFNHQSYHPLLQTSNRELQQMSHNFAFYMPPPITNSHSPTDPFISNKISSSKAKHNERSIAVVPPMCIAKNSQNGGFIPQTSISPQSPALGSVLSSISPSINHQEKINYHLPRHSLSSSSTSSSSSGYHSRIDLSDQDYLTGDITDGGLYACALDMEDHDPEMDCDESGEVLTSCKKKTGRKGRHHAAKTGNHLWEFVRDLLRDPKSNPKLLKWEDKENGVFRFVQSEQVAQLWGQKKNNPLMTYEKLSRAMRFCRKAGYFKQVPKNGKFPKKLCFMFGDKAHGWKE